MKKEKKASSGGEFTAISTKSNYHADYLMNKILISV